MPKFRNHVNIFDFTFIKNNGHISVFVIDNSFGKLWLRHLLKWEKGREGKARQDRSQRPGSARSRAPSTAGPGRGTGLQTSGFGAGLRPGRQRAEGRAGRVQAGWHFGTCPLGPIWGTREPRRSQRPEQEAGMGFTACWRCFASPFVKTTLIFTKAALGPCPCHPFRWENAHSQVYNTQQLYNTVNGIISAPLQTQVEARAFLQGRVVGVH